MAKLIVIYDDSRKATGRTKTILGKKSYGDMILKRQSMFSRVRQIVKRHENMEIVRVRNLEEFAPAGLPANTIFLHLLSSVAILSPDDLSVLLEKILYAKDNLKIGHNGKLYGGVFKDRAAYENFLNEYKNQGTLDCFEGELVDFSFFADLTDYNTLLMYISGGFDARYFNSLEGDNYTVTKKSTDKKKMKAEYSYYWLLPEPMKNWMVMPYDYMEAGEWAMYTMERMPMTDIAIRWTHGAIDESELKNILDKTFYFLNHRARKKVKKSEYRANQEKIYLDKVDRRIAMLKKMPEYESIETMVKVGTDYESVDEIVAYYKSLYRRVVEKNKTQDVSVVGHGDMFFANMLYSKELNLLRLIDPKGAVNEEDLWVDPYYDVVKLSHSVCGNYDFFNVGAYTIDLAQDMKCRLIVHFDNTRAKEIFREYLEKNDYDYVLVRLFEASLFLSMLPLHIDNVHKVFGFVLNAINILKEVEENV